MPIIRTLYTDNDAVSLRPCRNHPEKLVDLTRRARAWSRASVAMGLFLVNFDAQVIGEIIVSEFWT